MMEVWCGVRCCGGGVVWRCVSDGSVLQWRCVALWWRCVVMEVCCVVVEVCCDGVVKEV